jgi:hypothetical protein
MYYRIDRQFKTPPRAEIQILCLLAIIIGMKARCGHYVSESYARAHHGLCRKCHSNFAFLVELEEKHGDDALVEYWFSMIMVNLSDNRGDANCLIDHLIDFYQRKLVEIPSKQRYIHKMLFMLRSIKEPFDARKMA